MAFASNVSRQNSASSNEANWKAQGFLNLYLPNKDGKRTKLGAIPLKEGKPNEARLLAWLKEDPSRVAAIVSKLEIEFRTSEPTEGSAFAL